MRSSITTYGTPNEASSPLIMKIKMQIPFKGDGILFRSGTFEGLEERVRVTIQLGEGHFTEFKSGLHGAPGAKKKRSIASISADVAEALVAFGNSDGGTILIGVEDDRTVSGLSAFTDEEIRIIRRAPIDGVMKSVPLQSVRDEIVWLDGKPILFFSIMKGTDFIYQTADGRALKRREKDTIPISAGSLHFEHQEVASREYDRVFVDEAFMTDLDESLVSEASARLNVTGMTNDHFLQHYGLAEYSGTGLRLRRAALLLFAKDINRWHPRSQIRIVRVEGTELKVGADYNAMPDKIVSGNVLQVLQTAWDTLREYLVVMRLTKEGTFKPTAMYPDAACQEALINAVAHRDYAQEGRGIEIFIFHDRIEVSSPGALLSTVNIDVLRSTRIHESRNTFVTKVLKLLGYMQELGEGVRRIYVLMSSNELAPPLLQNSPSSFSVTLYNKPVYTESELLWLDQFKELDLSREHKAVLLMAREGRLLSTNEITKTVGLSDTDFTNVMGHLSKLRLVESVLSRRQLELHKLRYKGGRRDVPRFALVDPSRAPIVKPVSSTSRRPRRRRKLS